MLLTINQVLSARNSLGELNNIKLPISTAIKLNKDLNMINDVQDEFNKRQTAIYELHGTPGDGPGLFKFEQDAIPVVNDLLQAIGTEEVNLDIMMLDIAQLGDRAELSGNDLRNLDWYLDRGS